MLDVEIYTDGGCGAYKEGSATGGYGVVVVVEGQVVAEMSGIHTKTTNNRMELKALREALLYVHVHKAELGSVKVLTDSAYVLGGYTKWMFDWAKSSFQDKGKDRVNADMWRTLYHMHLSLETPIEFIKVKAHTGVEYNERADILSKGWQKIKLKKKKK